jgi:hypothetical protein
VHSGSILRENRQNEIQYFPAVACIAAFHVGMGMQQK